VLLCRLSLIRDPARTLTVDLEIPRCRNIPYRQGSNLMSHEHFQIKHIAETAADGAGPAMAI
jgi:hypothetical protein